MSMEPSGVCMRCVTVVCNFRHETHYTDTRRQKVCGQRVYEKAYEKMHKQTHTHRHTHTHSGTHTPLPLAGCSVDTYIIVSGGPAGVELHVELPFLPGQLVILSLLLPR